MERTLLVVLLLLPGGGCSDDKDKGDCIPGDSCGGGEVCAVVRDGEPACFAPVEVRGTVRDSEGGDPIGGAAVVALDADSGAISDRVRAGDDGRWSLEVPAVREETGRPVAFGITLRADAQGYESFPRPPRSAVAIDLAVADEQDGAWVVENAATGLVLVALDGAAAGVIRGTVLGGGVDGMLVVADVGGTAVSSAIVDRQGRFELFNVPVGTVQVAGYKAGLYASPVAVAVDPDGVDDVELQAVAANASVTGSVNRVDASGGEPTSVLLALESTFLEVGGRGEMPGGLRAGGVLGDWRIDGVPPGRYVVLAAFENDGLVRDPDEGISGTDLVRIDVTEGATVVAGQFKITAALRVLGPGADGLEDLSGSEPVFTWSDDASEDGYEVRVYDGRGQLVHEVLDVPRVTGAGSVAHRWTGASLEPGMIYQFRAWSYRIDQDQKRSYISATEDLKGVFRYAPAPAR